MHSETHRGNLSALEALVRAVRLSDGLLVDRWAAHKNPAVELQARVVQLLGTDERTTRTAAERVLARNESLLDELQWLCEAMFTIRRGLPVLRHEALARQLARIVSPDALLLFDERLELRTEDRFDWDCVPLPDGGRTDRLLRNQSIDTHIHLGGTLPPAFYWIPLMGGSLQLELLRGLPSAERGHGDFETWRQAIGRAISTRLSLALELEKRSREQSGRHLFPWLRDGWQAWLEEQLSSQERFGRDPDTVRETALEVDERFGQRPRDGTVFADALRPPAAREPSPHFAVGERRFLFQLRRALRQQTDRHESIEPIAERTRQYLTIRNSFHRLLVHDRGSEGLLRFVQTFGRRGILSQLRPRRSCPRSDRPRRKRSRRLRRHVRMATMIERRRMAYGLESQLVEPYTSDDTVLDAPPSGFDTRGAPSRGPDRCIELRVSVPRTLELVPTFRAWIQGISDHLSQRQRSASRQVGLIFHFIKRGSSDKHADAALNDAERLGWMLREEPWLRPLVVGIDAAGQERDANPRVFLRAFRFLQNLTRCFRPGPGEPPIRLGYTFHGGEDVDDLLTGLRHLDESASLLLPADDGGRLGHALALGESADRFYARRGTTEPTLGAHLLDLVWAWGRSVDAGETSHLRWIERRLGRLAGTRPTQLRACFDAMCLDRWPSASELRSERSLLEVLYDDAELPASADRLAAPIPVPQSDTTWNALVSAMQNDLKRRISHSKICIESNPTSNLLIGGYREYRELPYVDLVDAGLALSLNTDDPGLFMTTLPGELAAMYHALDERGWKHREILGWLRDRIFDAEQSAFLDPYVSTDEVVCRLETAWGLET